MEQLVSMVFDMCNEWKLKDGTHLGTHVTYLKIKRKAFGGIGRVLQIGITLKRLSWIT
jgi:hypothetical protein